MIIYGCPGVLKIDRFWQQLGSGINDLVDACRYSSHMVIEPSVAMIPSWSPLGLYPANRSIPFSMLFEWEGSGDCLLSRLHADHCCPAFTTVKQDRNFSLHDQEKTFPCIQIDNYKAHSFLKTQKRPVVKRRVTYGVHIRRIVRKAMENDLRKSPFFRHSFNGVALRTERMCLAWRKDKHDVCDKLYNGLERAYAVASENGTMPLLVASDLRPGGGTAGSDCQKCWPRIQSIMKNRYRILDDACDLNNSTGPICGLTEMVAISMAQEKFRLKPSTFHRFSTGLWSELQPA